MQAEESRTLQVARERLAAGFYEDNLRELAELSREACSGSSCPAAWFVINRIALGLADRWEGQPVSVEGSRALEKRVRPALYDLLQAIESGKRDDLYQALDESVTAYMARGDYV